MPPLKPVTMTEQLRQLRSGETTAEAMMSNAIRRAEDFGHLNAFLTVEPDLAMKRARAVDRARAEGAQMPILAGLPIGVKDNIDVEGWVTTGATPALAQLRAKTTAPVLHKLLQSQAVLLGKTNLHELAFGVTNTNFSSIPAVRNPHDPARISGGSSGGTAAAIAAGIISSGLGTDTSGSVRIPAALCGIAGLRPSVGAGGSERRYSAQGVLPISHTNDTPGPMAVSVEDLAVLDAVITGTDPVAAKSLKGVRLGVPDCFWIDIDPDVERVCRKLCGKLVKAGAELVSVSMPGLRDVWRQVSAPVVLHEPREDIPAWLASNGRSDISLMDIFRQIVNPDVRAAFEVIISENSDKKYRDALHIHRPELCRIYDAAFCENGLTALIFPTVPVPAIYIDIECAFGKIKINGEDGGIFDTLVRNTDPGANAGLPGLSIPVGLTRSGLPVGFEIDGPVGSDRNLIGIAIEIERVAIS